MSMKGFTVSCVIVAFSTNAFAADVAAGKTYFTNICTQCHSAEINDGGGEMGPILHGVFGQPAATTDAQFPYSPALKASKLVWTAEVLERFLANPMATVPGTTMPMPIPLKADRDNVIAYLQSVKDKK